MELVLSEISQTVSTINGQKALLENYGMRFMLCRKMAKQLLYTMFLILII